MRTTLELDDDIVAVARQLAQQRGLTIGQVISDLVRQFLDSQSADPTSRSKVRNGVILFDPKPGATRPTLSLVNQLRD